MSRPTNLRRGLWTITWANPEYEDTTVLIEKWDFGGDPRLYANHQSLHFIWENGEELLIPFTAIRVADYKAISNE